MLQFEKSIEMNATYAFYLPPFRQKKTGISKQMEIPVKPESIYEFIIPQRLTESKVALCFNLLHYLLFHRGSTRAIGSSVGASIQNIQYGSSARKINKHAESIQ